MSPAELTGYTPIQMTLTELIASASIRPDRAHGDAEILSVTDDSRRVTPGALFAVMPSARRDAHEFLPSAREAGAVAAVVHSEAGFDRARSLGMAAVHIEPRGQRLMADVARLAHRFHGDPTADLRVIGVTGTNGKTTTAWVIRDALEALGRRAAYLGTLGFLLPGGEMRLLNNTTPFPIELVELMVEARAAGVEFFVMEASSHGLYQRRLAGTRFDVGVFTNLTQDHLDFHGTMEDYAAAKKLLFTEYAMASGKPFVAAINDTDAIGQRWLADLPTPVVRFSDLDTDSLSVKFDGIEMRLGEHVAKLRLGGQFNVENAIAAAAALRALDMRDAEIARGLEAARPVPGRFEAVPNEQGIGVIVDYAHTPDALIKLIRSARTLGPKRLIVVFGCGGDRDRAKRPQMAAAVSAHADVTIVTSDNPRTEDPEAIIREIETGLDPGAVSESVVDRPSAVARAIAIAQPGDIVLIAGKGHEDYQIIGHTKHPMDDRDLAQRGLEARGR